MPVTPSGNTKPFSHRAAEVPPQGTSFRTGSVEPRWITPVIDAADLHLPGFQDAFDDHTAWGPAKQIATLLTSRGIDPTDQDAINTAIRTLNAEQLARQLTQHPPTHNP